MKQPAWTELKAKFIMPGRTKIVGISWHFAVPSFPTVELVVFTLRHYFQIVRVVVRAIVVFVVNNLFTFQWSPNLLLSNQYMLKDVAVASGTGVARHSNLDITVRPFVSTRLKVRMVAVAPLLVAAFYRAKAATVFVWCKRFLTVLARNWKVLSLRRPRTLTRAEQTRTLARLSTRNRGVAHKAVENLRLILFSARVVAIARAIFVGSGFIPTSEKDFVAPKANVLSVGERDSISNSHDSALLSRADLWLDPLGHSYLSCGSFSNLPQEG